MKKYYNNITKEKTKYPYRFKTKEEFIEEFGDGNGNGRWRFRVSLGWVRGMDHLLGTTYPSIIKNKYSKLIRIDGYGISYDMIIKNDNYSNLYKPRTLIYD